MERMGLTLLVCGSRDWTDEDWIASVLGAYLPIRARLGKQSRTPAPLTTVRVIHGDARGADRIADRVAKAYGYDVEAFPADWQTCGKRAGYIRNIGMLDQRPDAVLAFQVNGSRGTQHTVDEARKRGIPTYVFNGESDDCCEEFWDAACSATDEGE